MYDAKIIFKLCECIGYNLPFSSSHATFLVLGGYLLSLFFILHRILMRIFDTHMHIS
jgi:hypothetical protein